MVWWKIPFISRCCVFNDSSKIGRSQLLYCSKCSFMLNKVTCLLVNDAKWWDIIFSAHFWIVANQELEFRKVDSLTLALKPLASLVGAGLTCPLFWILVLDWLQNKNEPQKRYLIIFHHSPVNKLPFFHCVPRSLQLLLPVSTKLLTRSSCWLLNYPACKYIRMYLSRKSICWEIQLATASSSKQQVCFVVTVKLLCKKQCCSKHLCCFCQYRRT